MVADRAPTYALSFAAGRAVPTDSADTLADGLAVRVPNEDALAACLKEPAEVAGRSVGVLLTGGNVDRELFAAVLAEKESS